MDWIENIVTLEEVVEQLDPSPPREESPWHCTNIVDGILRAAGQETFGPADEAPEGILHMGRLWEAAVRPWVTHWATQRGWTAIYPQFPFHKDEIIMTVDGILNRPDEDLPAVIETKSRWSRPRDPRGRLRDMMQTKSYCKVIGATTVFMPILYLTSGPPMARVRMHQVDFTQKQIDDHWNLMVQQRDRTVA